MLSKQVALSLIVNIITNYTYATVSESNIMAYVGNRSPFSSRPGTSNFSSVPVVFRQFLTRIVRGDADLCFSMMLVRKASAAEEETKQAVWLYPNIINPYT